jgi:hypothetical protein
VAVEIAGETIERIAIVDDQPTSRESWEYTAEDLGAEAVLEEGPIKDLDRFVAATRERAQAVLCDFRLRVGNYSTVDGAEVVAGFYRAAVPAVLCTKWENAAIDDIRKYLPWIPSMMKPDELSPPSLSEGLVDCNPRSGTGDGRNEGPSPLDEGQVAGTTTRVTVH